MHSAWERLLHSQVRRISAVLTYLAYPSPYLRISPICNVQSSIPLIRAARRIRKRSIQLPYSGKSRKLDVSVIAYRHTSQPKMQIIYGHALKSLTRRNFVGIDGSRGRVLREMFFRPPSPNRTAIVLRSSNLATLR